MAPVGHIGQIVGKIGKVISRAYFEITRDVTVNTNQRSYFFIIRFVHFQPASFQNHIPFAHQMQIRAQNDEVGAA